MNENRITINELATKMVDELRRIGYSEETIWRNYHPKIRMVVNYYERAGITYYSLKSTDEMLKLYEERCKRSEITNHYLRQMRSIALRMNEFFVTGTLCIWQHYQYHLETAWHILFQIHPTGYGQPF